MTTRTTRRRVTPPADTSNVVSLHRAEETTEDIVRDVQNRNAAMSRAITHQLQQLLEQVQEAHRQKVQALLPIGYAMTGPALADWLEIGQRMLGQGGRRA